MRRTLAAMEQMQQRLQAQTAAQREPIAIVGLGCRFPGVDGPDEFADFVQRGESVVGNLPDSRIADASGPVGEDFQVGGFFEDIAGFDADGFGVTPEEALAMDPHLRVLLEISRDALEDAALPGDALKGSRTGVYLALGAQNNDYASGLMTAADDVKKHAIAGSFHSLMPGRLSYHFDLRGPSFVVDAACASSLVAIDLACQALRNADCDIAIVSAVNLVLSDMVSAAIDSNGLWSKQGRVCSFGSTADGFVRGEGAGALVLKRVGDAITDGDPIRSVILGAASGQDGRGNGVAAPNAPAQAAVMQRALKQAQVPASEIAYVEAHATGTLLGDAIEVEAIDQVYGAAEDRESVVTIGALKPLLGHLEASSGIAALIKMALALSSGHLPKTLRPRSVNPEIEFLEDRISLEANNKPWPEKAPYAAVSAFGMSGTNAHVVLGPAPVVEQPRNFAPPYYLKVSAPDEELLRQTARRLSEQLCDETNIAAFCNTLRVGRNTGAAQFSALVSSNTEARRVVESVANGELLPQIEFHGRTLFPIRLNLAPTAYRKRRFWPDITSSAPSVVQSKKPINLDGLFFANQWKPIDLSSAPRLKNLVLRGNAQLVERVGSILSSANVPFNQQPVNGSTCTVIYCAGRAFSDLEELRACVKKLSDGPGQSQLLIAVLGAETGNPLASAALALGRCISVEHPDLQVRMIDIDDGELQSGKELVHALCDERSEILLRVSRDGLLVSRLRSTSHAHVPYKPNPLGAYLVTGGFGGIGRAVAKRLVERGAKHLVLMGRSEHVYPEHAEFEAESVRITRVAGNVADNDTVVELFDRFEETGHPIAGVFHAAGTAANDLLVRQDQKSFATPFQAKLLGASVLDSVTRKRDLEVFALFSSLTAFVPLAGAGSYGAANASLGALARARRRDGYPAVCIHWGTWAGSGMLNEASASLAGQWTEHGINTMPQSQALDAMEALLAADVSDEIAASCDWNKIHEHADRENSDPALYSELIDRRIEPSARPQSEEEDIAGLVRGVIARIVHLEPDDPRLDTSFGDLGLGSLAAIELRNELSARLGLRLPASLAFNYPSVPAIVEELNRRTSNLESK